MRILIVEDERKISAYVKRGLEEQGYAVDAAYTGREALDAYMKQIKGIAKVALRKRPDLLKKLNG